MVRSVVEVAALATSPAAACPIDDVELVAPADGSVLPSNPTLVVFKQSFQPLRVVSNQAPVPYRLEPVTHWILSMRYTVASERRVDRRARVMIDSLDLDRRAVRRWQGRVVYDGGDDVLFELDEPSRIPSVILLLLCALLANAKAREDFV